LREEGTWRGGLILDWKFLQEVKKEEKENWENKSFWKLSQGTVVAGNFGLRGQETARIPGTREPERLFLVGWEVNIQLDSLDKLKNKRTKD
jgi:hypothetical protein